jgi:hypothetical protein
MRSLCSSLVLVLIAIAASSLRTVVHAEPDKGSERPQLKVLKTIPLGGDGEWGFPTIDVEARRLYLPRTKVVQVFDLDKGTLIGTLPDVSKQVDAASNEVVAVVAVGDRVIVESGTFNTTAEPFTLKSMV